MTAALTPEGTRPNKVKNPAAVKIALAGEPSVQLLPPEVRDRAVARSRMRTGVLFVLLGVLVVVGMVAMTSLRAQQAQQALTDANNLTADLLVQQAQYSDATNLAALIEQAYELQKAATETEVSWGEVLTSLVAKLPAEGYIMDIAALGAPPWAGPIATTSDPAVDNEVVAQITLKLQTLTVQDATNYSRSLSTLTGFQSATISDVAVGVDGRVSSSLTLLLNRDATSGRFMESEKTDDATTDDVSKENSEGSDDSASTTEEEN